MLVDRVNTVTGQAYCDDATIMAWQLANEPRPGNNAANAGGPFAGDDYMGDPPHEPQGLYGVFDTDRTTLEVIRKFADKMRKTGAP